MVRLPAELPRDVPHARGTLVAGALAAIAELWGAQGVAEVRHRLGAAARRAILDEIVLPVGWYPEEHFESLCEAVWSSLARHDVPVFETFIRRSIDHVWGRVHRMLMSLATPHLLARRAPALWRHDHTHGELAVELRERDGTVRVRGYPYAPSSIMPRGQAESLRYILSHARVRDVRASHLVDVRGEFVVTLGWT